MWITNNLTPPEALSEMLMRQRYRKSATDEFSALRHDANLCPRFHEQIAAILSVYESHHTGSYDIQGMRDEGIDVIANCKLDDGDIYRIGFQIKSYDEIERWAKGKDKSFIQHLKAQYADAVGKVKVQTYYIALCTDAKAHAKQIRLICSEFKTTSAVKIILPEYALAFYKAPDYEVAGALARLLCKNDRILELATKELARLSPAGAYMVICLVCHAFNGGGNDNRNLRVDDGELGQWFSEWQENFAPRRDKTAIENVYGELIGSYLSMNEPEVLEIDVGGLPKALCALYFDYVARTDGCDENQLFVLLDLDQ